MDLQTKQIIKSLAKLNISGLNDYDGQAYETNMMWVIEQYLKAAYGFQYCGGGNFSGVFEHPLEPNSVYKIGLKGHIDGWLQWADYSMQAKNKHMLPDIDFVLHLTERVFVAKLAKVVTYEDWTDKQHVLFGTVSGIIHAPWNGVARLWERMKAGDKLDKWQLRDVLEYNRRIKKAATIKDKLLELSELNMAGDLHEGNIGFTFDNKMVLLDPLAWMDDNFESDFKRLSNKQIKTICKQVI